MLEIKINSNSNDAFVDDDAAEVARILREVADKLENGERVFPIRDINGNQCGYCTDTPSPITY